MEKAELLARTKAFALRSLKLVDHLPRTISGRAIGAACRARSRAEFAAKLGIVAQEADESVYWLELIRDGGLVAEGKMSELLKEADELTAIFTAGRRTSSKNQTSNLKRQT